MKIWSKTYSELPKGFYSASVETDAPWDGWTQFRAYPDIGSGCLEFVAKDRDTVLQVADGWLRGERPEGVYSASY